ncbi:unnamed protein product, partial [Polarella glacialis]
LYEECAQAMPWRQAVYRKRNQETGEVTVTTIASNRQDSSYRCLTTGIPRLDAALQRVVELCGITDPGAFLLNNWYPDGNTSIAPHMHDFWSAILSFGQARVFMLDGQPVLLGDGDLIVFGTQRHSVPKMPKVSNGRVSVAIFWYPEEKAEPEYDPATAETAAGGTALCTGCQLQGLRMQEASDGLNYCEGCWDAWQEQNGRGLRDNYEGETTTEDDLMAAILQLSMTEF